jgi:hypothetical protein
MNITSLSVGRVTSFARGVAEAVSGFLRALPRTRRSLALSSDAAGNRLSLGKGAIQSFHRPTRYRFECIAGCVWITHDRDPGDTVLAPGQAYLPDRNSRLLVYALEDTQFRIVPVRPGMRLYFRAMRRESKVAR